MERKEQAVYISFSELCMCLTLVNAANTAKVKSGDRCNG